MFHLFSKGTLAYQKPGVFIFKHNLAARKVQQVSRALGSREGRSKWWGTWCPGWAQGHET